jgi:hypothetical protein
LRARGRMQGGGDNPRCGGRLQDADRVCKRPGCRGHGFPPILCRCFARIGPARGGPASLTTGGDRLRNAPSSRGSPFDLADAYSFGLRNKSGRLDCCGACVLQLGRDGRGFHLWTGGWFGRERRQCVPARGCSREGEGAGRLRHRVGRTAGAAALWRQRLSRLKRRRRDGGCIDLIGVLQRAHLRRHLARGNGSGRRRRLEQRRSSRPKHTSRRFEPSGDAGQEAGHASTISR